MSGFTSELLRDVHRIVNEGKRPIMVNEGNKPLSPEMEKKVKERAFELADKLTNVDEDKVEKILRRMAASGDDLDDLEALEQELGAMGTSVTEARQPKLDLTMSADNEKYTIIGYANGEVLDVTEVKGSKSVKNITSSWESSGRYTEVIVKPKNQLLKNLRKILKS